MFVEKRLLVTCLILYLGACFSLYEQTDWTVYPGCMKNGEGYGVFPKDPYFLENQALVIECFTEKRFKNLAFWIGHHKADSKYVWQNGTYARLQIPRLTATNITEIGNANIICQDTSNDACIDNTFLQLDYYPQDARNISCLVDNFDTLSCTWELGVDYKHPKHVNVKCQFLFNVSTKYKIHPSAENWADCPNGSKNSCFWDSSNYHNSLVILLKINVTNTKYSISREKNVTIERDNVLKPGKVKNISVLHTNDSTCVTLQWLPPYTFRNFSYKITYSSICEATTMTAHHSCKDSWCSYRLCRLNPFTNYTLNIISRYSPQRIERGFWSDVATKNFQTAKAIPSRNPISTEGLYQYEHPYLTLYWLPLGRCELHSDDTEYQVSLPGVTKTVMSSEFRLETKLQLENTSINSFNVNVYAENSIGRVVDPHVMKIIHEKYGPSDSELIIEYVNNGTDCKEYYATIKINPQTLEKFMNITHTITWCQVETGATTICMEPWHVLENISEVVAIPVDITDCNRTYTFGLITKGRHKHSGERAWSGINIINCIYPYDTVPKESLPNIRLSKVMLPNTLTVEWEPYPCDGLEPVGYIENYIVTYCETREPDTQETCDCLKQRNLVRVSNDRSSYTVEHLESDLPVCVWVSANTSAGVGPKNLKPLFHKVGQGENTLHPILIIVPIFGGVALIALVVILVRRCKARFKRWMEGLKKIDVPIGRKDSEEVPMVEPKDPQYPLVDGGNKRAEDLDFYYSDEDTNTSYEEMDSGQEILDGYRKPKELEDISDISVNSDLSLHDGIVCINGKNMTVKDKGYCKNSLEYLSHDAEIVNHQPTDKEDHDDNGDDEDAMSTNSSAIIALARQPISQSHIPEFNEMFNTQVANLLDKIGPINIDSLLKTVDTENEQIIQKKMYDSEMTVPKTIHDDDNESENDECCSDSEALLHDRLREPLDEMGIATKHGIELTNLMKNYGADVDSIGSARGDFHKHPVLNNDCDIELEVSRTLLQKKSNDSCLSKTNIDDKNGVFNIDNQVMDCMPGYFSDTNTNNFFHCETNDYDLKTNQFYTSNKCMDGYSDASEVQDSNFQPNQLPSKSGQNYNMSHYTKNSFNNFSRIEDQDSAGTDHLNNEIIETNTEGDKEFSAINQNAMINSNLMSNSETLNVCDSSNQDCVFYKSSSNSDYVTIATLDRRVLEIPNQVPGEVVIANDEVRGSEQKKQRSLSDPIMENLTYTFDKASVSNSDLAHSIATDIISEFVSELLQKEIDPKSAYLSEAYKTELVPVTCIDNSDGIQVYSSEKTFNTDQAEYEENVRDGLYREISNKTDSSNGSINSAGSSASGPGTPCSTPSYILASTLSNHQLNPIQGNAIEADLLKMTESEDNENGEKISDGNDLSNDNTHSAGSSASGSGTSSSTPTYVLMSTLSNDF